MGILLVLRHSKSAYPDGVADSARPLSGRGQRDAAAAGTWLHSQGLIPDLVLCSTARRAKQTWQLASAQFGRPGASTEAGAEASTGTTPGGDRVRYESRLYLADTEDLVSIIRETPDTVHILALVGHNPGSGELAAGLAAQASLGFPTSALAVIEFGCGWPQVTPGMGTLAQLWTPKGGPA